MVYISPIARAPGALITAAIWNADIVANEQASAPDAFTTKGDLFSATGADAGVRLGVGADGQILIADSTAAGGLAWTPIITVNKAGNMVLIGASLPATPDGTLHVHTASAGAIAPAAAADDLIIENSSAVGLTFLSPNNQSGQINFGDPDNNDVGIIQYAHTDDKFRFYAGGVLNPALAVDGDGITLKQLDAAPGAPIDGLVVYADGAGWDPGSGEGYYGYYGAAWHFLG